MLGVVQFDGQHQALAAHVHDHGVFLLQVLQSPTEVSAHVFNMGQQSAAFDFIEHRHGNMAGQRTAAKGRSMQPGVHRARYFFRAQHRAQRQAACYRLGNGDDVRLGVVMLKRKPLARAPKACLDLVDNQQATRRARHFACCVHENLRHGANTALALDRLDKQRAVVA